MKIELLSIGENQISVMSVLREISDMSLSDAHKMTENLPSSFVCNLADEKMPEILKKFEQTGTKIEFTAGIGGPKKNTPSNYIGKILFREKEEEKTEEQKLTKFSEIKDYLQKKSNFGRAVAAALIGCLFLTVIISVVYAYDGEREWWYDILIGLTLGYSVKHAGKGTDGRFGILAAIFTLLTLILLKISFTIILIRTNELSFMDTFAYAKPGQFEIVRALLCAYLAFSISFTLVEKSDEKKSILSTSNKLSEYIQSRKKDQFKTIIAKNEKLLNNALHVTESVKKEKSKKTSANLEPSVENGVVETPVI